MPLPNIVINFSKAAQTASRRAGQGVVALIIKDNGVTAGLLTLGSVSDIPAGLSATNKAYIADAFVGNVNRPAKVLVYVLATTALDLDDALAELATRQFDWLVGPPDCTSAEATAIATWVKGERTNNAAKYKAVLPETAADHEAIVDFNADDIKVGSAEYDGARYCARIAGLLAGTPLTQSVTYAPLSEVSDVARMTKADMDDAVDDGKLILMHDGVKVKVARGVTSLTTTTTTPADYKKIKIVETVDLIRYDLRLLCQDNYIGKMPNSYDNKCVLITAIKEYLSGLESDGVLEAGKSVVEIDVDAQRTYLASQGVDVSTMTDTQIKQANTGSQVFIKATISILDAIEDITININF
jgi:hypothetical protein